MVNMMTANEFGQIFRNIEDILATNTALFSDMEEVQIRNNNFIERIGRVFLTHVSLVFTYILGTITRTLSAILWQSFRWDQLSTNETA